MAFRHSVQRVHRRRKTRSQAWAPYVLSAVRQSLFTAHHSLCPDAVRPLTRDFDPDFLASEAAMFGTCPALSSTFLLTLSSRAEDHLPYPEVHSAVSNMDDPSMPCNTLPA